MAESIEEIGSIGKINKEKENECDNEGVWIVSVRGKEVTWERDLSEGGLSCREVGVLKKWVLDNEKEKKRRNIIIKGLDILKEIEKDGKERRRWVNEFTKERLT